MSKFIAAAVLCATSLGAQATELLVPAYFYPSSVDPAANFWPELTAALASGPITAIANLSAESTTVVNPEYAAAIDAFRAAGGRVIGYVDTGYGAIGRATLEADIARYDLYGVNGIFLDDMATGSDLLDSYYKPLYQSIKADHPGYLVIGNPGTGTLEGYLQAADVLVTKETSSANYASATPQSWQALHDASHFANLIYGTATAASMLDQIALARARNAGYVYVTNDVLPNPWDTLPPYLLQELAAAVPEPSVRGYLPLALAFVAVVTIARGRRPGARRRMP